MTAPYDDPTKVTQIIPRVTRDEYRDEIWCPHCENFRPEGPGKHRDDLLNDDPDAITVYDLMDRDTTERVKAAFRNRLMDQYAHLFRGDDR